MGGGQSASAEISQTNDIVTINQSTVALLNQMINQTTSNTVINQATQCSSTSQTTLSSLFSDLQAKGDITITNNMNAKVSVDITCINSSTIGITVGANVSANLIGQIQTAFNTLASQATSGQATAGTSNSINPFDALMKNTSASDIKQYNTATTTNDSKTIVQSMIQNITTNNFTTNIMNELKSNVISSMAAQYNNMVAGGNINITNLMSSVQDIVAQQVIQMGIGTNVTSQLLQTFNVGVTTTATTEIKQTAKAEAEATSISTGLAGIISALGPWGSLGGSGSSTSCSIICIIIIVVLLMGMA